MPKRDFKGVWIPREVWTDEKLSWMEKLVFVEVDSLQDQQRGGCYASNQYLARFFGLSQSRVSEIITSLCRKGKVRRFLVHHPLDGRMETARLLKTERLTLRHSEGGTRRRRFTPSENRNTPSGNREYSIQGNKQDSPGAGSQGTGTAPGPRKIVAGEIRDPFLRELFLKSQKKKEEAKKSEEKNP